MPLKTEAMHVLIVDDDPFFLNLMTHNLNAGGHTVLLAQDGKQAISSIEHNKEMDIIICDINMPVLTGPSFILSIRRLYKKRPVIIIVSGSKDGEAFMKKIEVEFDYYFEKPVNMEAFNDTLSRIQASKK